MQNLIQEILKMEEVVEPEVTEHLFQEEQKFHYQVVHLIQLQLVEEEMEEMEVINH